MGIKLREKAAARPIDGPYPELAKAVRELLGYCNDYPGVALTSREASRKTGVNHATITTMMRGDRPSEGTILKLAKGLGGDAAQLLFLAGYLPADYDIIPKSSEGKSDRNKASAFGEWLRDARLRRGMTQADLGVATEIDQGLISKYETGALLPPKPMTVRVLAQALSVVSDIDGIHADSLYKEGVQLAFKSDYLGELYRDLDPGAQRLLEVYANASREEKAIFDTLANLIGRAR